MLRTYDKRERDQSLPSSILRTYDKREEAVITFMYVKNI